MALSVHYSGKLKDIAVLPQLTKEVQDVCTVPGWHYGEIAKGITYTPIESKSFASI